jgi:uncharacterized protein
MVGLADRFVYFPRPEHDGATPASIGLKHQDVSLSAADGVRFHAWMVPAACGALTVLFFYGNAGNISHRLDKVAVLHALGVAVFLLDCRGYGLSEGTPRAAARRSQ